MGIVNGMADVIGRGMLCTLALACAGPVGIETPRAYAKIIDEVNQLDLSALVPVNSR